MENSISMMKKMIAAFYCLMVVVFVSFAQQAEMRQRHKIALFAPLYLDSAFAGGSSEYNYGKFFPRFLSPGLEFYEGAQLALDSLERAGVPLEVNVYDTRSVKSLEQITSDTAFAGTQLIIAHVSSYNEIRSFADIASAKNIPFINANLPNDGGVTGNTQMVILNSTLRAHCQGIYRFLQKNHATAPIIAFQKNGTQENTLKTYFNDIARSTSTIPLKIKFITLNNNFTAQQLMTYLDSTELTVCLGASLDEGFAKNLSQQLAYLSKVYPSKLIGMPTWDNIPFEKKEYAGLEVLYSTPFYSAKTDTISKSITNHFATVFYSRPSDMVFRGYECIFHFGKLLAEHGSNLGSALGEKKYKAFTDFDIQPVFLNGPSQRIDYFENKKLYFIKKVNGEIKGVY